MSNQKEKKEIVITGSKVVFVVLCLAFLANIIATIFVLIDGGSLLPEWSFVEVIIHPPFLTLVFGILFFMELPKFLKKK